MPTCFVIQPFDADKFDRRFEEVYSPAIQAAGLEPYRVDRDVAVDIPIDSIESGIRGAAICLADITTDNPNVWYELGFAFASGRAVVMVCSDERTGKKYPFDIQHRTVIEYKAQSPSDFASLQAKITNRIKASSHARRCTARNSGIGTSCASSRTDTTGTCCFSLSSWERCFTG